MTAYLEEHQLSRYMTAVVARTFSDVTLLKPNPHLLIAAMRTAGVVPDDCVMVGDSLSDIAAARAAGVAMIAFANKPDKRRH